MNANCLCELCALKILSFGLAIEIFIRCPFNFFHVVYVLQFHAFDFRTTMKNEPFLQLFHCLYVYPLTVSLARKRNLFIQVELREDDIEVNRQPLEVYVSQLLLLIESCMVSQHHFVSHVQLI